LRGDFEERIATLITEINKKKKIILYIDEIHLLVGAGGNGGSNSLDAANLLQPIFDSRKIRCIGATTFEDYTRTIEKQSALARRFQKIDILEPTEDESIIILKGLQQKYEQFHIVTYSEQAIISAVKLSKQFISNRYLPDKAIDVIDEAGAYVQLHPTECYEKNDQTHPVVSHNLIEKIVSKIARIPEITIETSEKEALKKLESNLLTVIFGQDEAIRLVSQAVKRSRSGFRSTEKTVANFLFAGPTGVGKTELAKKLGETLGIPLLRFDMSEYQEKHTVSRLIGSPPGYVGFEGGGLLTDAVLKDPHAVVLFDEIEKAHQDIYNILLQVMDYASLTDSKGKKADFKNCIIIMTSNAGARDVNKSLIGFTDAVHGQNAVIEAVEKIFTPEFRNRLDAVVPFTHLIFEIMKDITQKELKKLSALLIKKGVTLDFSVALVDYLTEIGYSQEFGARNIARTIDTEIASCLVDEILFGKLEHGGKAFFDLKLDDANKKTISVTYEPLTK
ncbi:MAG: AAA family ATPase, partial [Treponemataceae bacterium]